MKRAICATLMIFGFAASAYAGGDDFKLGHEAAG